MHFRRLGSSGLEVSALGFGCMGVGEPSRGPDKWTLDQRAAEPLIVRALDAGINFFDTANVYSDGSSEEILGAVLKRHCSRDRVVISTKVYGSMSKGPNSGGLSRKSILQEVDASLTRLDTEYIDLLFFHRWDPSTPIAETLDVVDVLIAQGKVRYWGASSMYAWQFAKLIFVADLLGKRRPIAMQDQYNLLARDEEREMHPLCFDQKIGVTPWSPLARGRLARPPAHDNTPRCADDAFGDSLYSATASAGQEVRKRVYRLAQEHGTPMAAIALSWMTGKTAVACPIVGYTSESQLAESLLSLDIRLTAEEISYLEEPLDDTRALGFS